MAQKNDAWYSSKIIRIQDEITASVREQIQQKIMPEMRKVFFIPSSLTWPVTYQTKNSSNLS